MEAFSLSLMLKFLFYFVGPLLLDIFLNGTHVVILYAVDETFLSYGFEAMNGISNFELLTQKFWITSFDGWP